MAAAAPTFDTHIRAQTDANGLVASSRARNDAAGERQWVWSNRVYKAEHFFVLLSFSVRVFFPCYFFFLDSEYRPYSFKRRGHQGGECRFEGDCFSQLVVQAAPDCDTKVARELRVATDIGLV